jgi:hypothetical protein
MSATEEDLLEEMRLEQELVQMMDEPDVPDEKVVTGQEQEPLTDEEIVAILDREIEGSTGSEYSTVQDARLSAMNYYRGAPRGDEEQGRSTVQSTDVADVIEWMMPSIMEGLMDPNGTVAFDPESEEDEDQADQETEAVNYVFTKRCDGFTVLHTFVKDALLLRNGVVKVYQCEQRKVRRETYEGLNPVEMSRLMQELGPGDQIVETDSRMEPTPPELQPVLGPEVELTDVTIRRRITDSKSVVEPIPMEEFLLNADHNSVLLAGARFTGHRRITTVGTLLDEGWELEKLEDLPPYSYDENEEREQRFEEEENYGTSGEADEKGDILGRTVQIIECYRCFDLQKDGTPELYQVFLGGNSGGRELLSMEPWDSHPFVGTTPIIMSHKFMGVSIWDRCREIQDQKTGIWRSILDNLYLQNNTRMAAVVGQVNLDDLLTSRPGGVVRQKAPGMVEPLMTPPVGPAAYTALEYLDKVRDGRTGVSPEGAAMNAIPGNSPAHSVERMMTAKEKLVGLIIRVIAETGVKHIMLKLRELLTKYQDQELPVPIRGTWTTVNPVEWRERGGATVKVGLGTGDRLKQQALIREVISLQAQVASGGGMGVLVTHDHMHRALEDFVRFSSMGKPEDYWQDPKSDEAKQFIQQQQQKAQQQEQLENQAESMIVKLQAQLESQDLQNQQMKMMLEDAAKKQELAFKYDKLVEEMGMRLTELEAKTGSELSQQHQDNLDRGNDGTA